MVKSFIRNSSFTVVFTKPKYINICILKEYHKQVELSTLLHNKSAQSVLHITMHLVAIYKINKAIVGGRLRPQSCWHKGCKWKQEILYIVTNLITRGQTQLSRVIHAGGTHM